MKVIDLPRRGGKTELMLKWMQEGEHRVLVSHSFAESERVWRLARDRRLPLERWQFVSVAETPNLTGRRFVLGVDNAELVLDYLLRASIGALSVTGDGS